MKINDISPVNEGVGDAVDSVSRGLFGNHAVSAIKGAFSGKGTHAQLTQDIFIKDFYQDAITSLSNAIASGIVRLPSREPKPQASPQPQQAPVSESKYRELDAIFESIVNEAKLTGENISQFMLQWFGTYMNGVNWKRYRPRILQLINQVESTYYADKGRRAIKQLAKAAFAICGPIKTIPTGARNAVQDFGVGTSGTPKKPAADPGAGNAAPAPAPATPNPTGHDFGVGAHSTVAPKHSHVEDAVQALKGLGQREQEARRNVANAMNSVPNNSSLADVIRAALRGVQ